MYGCSRLVFASCGSPLCRGVSATLNSGTVALVYPIRSPVVAAGDALLVLDPRGLCARTFPQGAQAPQAGGVIHADFEKGFVKA